METMEGMKRTHHCGELRATNEGQEVVLCGWVSHRRDHGGLIFIDLRDRSGLVQLVFAEDKIGADQFPKAESLRSEFVVAVRGKVSLRDKETINPNMETGEIEIYAEELRILNKALTPPFYIQDGIDVDEQIQTITILNGNQDEFFVQVNASGTFTSGSESEKTGLEVYYRILKAPGGYLAKSFSSTSDGSIGLVALESPLVKDVSQDQAYHFVSH